MATNLASISGTGPGSGPKRRIARTPKPKPLTLNAAQYERLTVIAQVRRAFLPGARLAGFTGLAIGGFVPVATWTLVHYEVSALPLLWWLVAGGLVYSALTVFQWGKAAFGNAFKAVGYCVLLEGILCFGHCLPLSLSALTILVFVNAISATCALQIRKNAEPTAKAARASSGSMLGLN